MRHLFRLVTESENVYLIVVLPAVVLYILRWVLGARWQDSKDRATAVVQNQGVTKSTLWYVQPRTVLGVICWARYVLEEPCTDSCMVHGKCLFVCVMRRQSYGWLTPNIFVCVVKLYFLLWFYRLWLPGCISLLVLKILSNRFEFLDNLKGIFQMPAVTPHSNQSDLNKRKEPRRSTKMHSQLRELIHSKDLTDWISQMTKIWGPYGQALLDENISYLERLKK